jgi:hypothetical protein
MSVLGSKAPAITVSCSGMWKLEVNTAHSEISGLRL